MLQLEAGMLKERLVEPAIEGPPKAPVELRVSAILQGVTGTKFSGPELGSVSWVTYKKTPPTISDEKLY
jgi:hypothetical protein